MNALLASIFLNPDMQQAVKEVHLELTQTEGVSKGTLREHFALRKSPLVCHLEIMQEMEKDKPEFNQFGKLDIIECTSVFTSRHRIMNVPQVAKILDTVNPNIHAVIEASLVATKPMQAYAFKTLVINLDAQHHKNMLAEGRFGNYVVGQAESLYQGMLPCTSPVQLAEKFLFGHHYGDNQFGHTLFCQAIAKEINISPLYVDTALYVFGMRLKHIVKFGNDSLCMKI